MQISIDFEQLRSLEANLRAAPGVVREELLAAMTEADMLLLREVKERMPSGAFGASGGMKGRSFNEERVGEIGVEGFVGSSAPYTEYVELGTRPHFPPIEALIDWVKVKFSISDDREARGVAFLVARKISRVGTKGAGMFAQGFAAVEPQVRAIFNAAADRIAMRVTGGAAGGAA